MAVHLQDVPQTPAELEDYVAALFQTSGYFVEKNITERDFTEILELDAVATSYDGGLPDSVLAEAKSGDWGFADIFKVAGWMRYLDLPRGALFVSKDIPGKDPAAVQQKVSNLGISVVHLGDFSSASTRFQAAGFPPPKDDLAFDIWRYSYWIERNLLRELRKVVKADVKRKGPAAILNLHRLINDKVFFVKDVRQRLNDLYDAYKDHPRVALGTAIEMAGGQYEPFAQGTTNQQIYDAIYKSQHPELQAAFYVEHRARLAILKCAIDYTRLSAAGKFAAAQPGQLDWNATLFRLLPTSFHVGLAQLAKELTFHRYALVWQNFLWVLGGFYLKDKEAEEFQWLADLSGIPATEVPTALTAMDRLFPNNWIAQNGPSQCVICKLVPSAFRGIGAIHRRERYKVDQYSKIGNYVDYTARDLSLWHNAAVDLLNR
jgi:hypothetical protein